MSVRFAPSPTGAFHIGNFRTAWVSWKWAQFLSVPWVVRFEDIDKPRVVPGAQARQLKEMASLGLTPDLVLTQTAKEDFHFLLFEKARAEGVIYPCVCSRKDVLNSLASAPHEPEALYSGHCRAGADLTRSHKVAWRFRSPDESGQFDFVIGRTDARIRRESFLPAYHWACAIDDWEENHILLVRAIDLANATPIQRQIQDWLRRGNTKPYPGVFHTSLVMANDGSRLEKRTLGITLPELKISPAELAQKFEKSFATKSSEFSQARVWGEEKESLKLSDLGL